MTSTESSSTTATDQNVPPPPPPPDNTISFPALDDYKKLPLFSFRNGKVDDAVSLLVKPTIAAVYHWRFIAGLPHGQAKNYVGAHVKQYWAILNTTTMTELNADQKKKAAILLGTARAIMTSYYEITEQDMIPGEVADPILEASRQEDGSWVFSPVSTVSDQLRAELAGAFELGTEDKAAVSSAHLSALGILPTQGYSLVMTNHHYLSSTDTQSFKAFLAIEKQLWRSTHVSTWWSADQNDLRDILWHKAGHPVSITLKELMASKVEIRDMLSKAGVGSAASRLPVKETELRAANSYMTLLKTVRGNFQDYGGKVFLEPLTEAMATVDLFPVGVAVDANATVLFPTVPDTVVDRKTALKHLGNVLDINSDVVALAYGFYTAMMEADVGGSTKEDSLKTSFSLGKLNRQSPAAYVQGRQAFDDFAAYRNRQRAEGRFQPRSIQLKTSFAWESVAEVPKPAATASTSETAP